MAESDEAPQNHGGPDFLLGSRRVAMFACVVGAGLSLVFMYQVGHRNPSTVLVLFLFSAWVLSPFVALMVGALASRVWALHGVMLAVSGLSPVAYGIAALGPPRG